MPDQQKQLPPSSDLFSYDNRTDGPPDHYVLTPFGVWHNEPLLICMLMVMYQHRGSNSISLPLWRMNGAGPGDSKIPVILCHGAFSNRFGIDYGINGEVHSLARFLANRGRDVWIIELEHALDYSSITYINYLNDQSATWRTWYLQYLLTTDQATYSALDAYFQATDICNLMTPIVTSDDRFTSTVDNFVFKDVPAIISAILHITGQSKIQWVGHSLGATIIFGMMPTQYTTDGKTGAGYLEGTGWLNLPPDSILSLTALNVPTALIDVPQWLMNLKNAGELHRAWRYRGKLPRFFNYISEQAPRWPVKMKGIMDTASLKHLDIAIDYAFFAFFNFSAYAQQYYHDLYEGASLAYAWPEWRQFTVYGHHVYTPVTVLSDGNGYDELGTPANIHWLYDRLRGYKNIKQFYQYRQDWTCHSEMINGYVVEGGDPTWPTNLNYTFGGTFHYVWYDLNRYLPPSSFSAYINDASGPSAPLVSWQNKHDAVKYELWAQLDGGTFVKLIENVNEVCSATHATGISSGVWKLKVRAYSLGGNWIDSSGMSSTGDIDDPDKFLTFTKL